MRSLLKTGNMIRFVAAAFWIANATAIQAQFDAATPPASSEEKKIPPDKAPPADGVELPLWRAPALVQDTIREQSGTNVVKRFVKQREGDDLRYRADFIRDGVPIQITVAENGTLISPSARQQIREAAGAKK